MNRNGHRILSFFVYFTRFLMVIGSTDIDTARDRRFSNIVGAVVNATSIPSWLSTLDASGKWPDSEINYTSGCDAQVANWPAEDHWIRILTMSAGWHGGLEGAEQYTSDPTIRSAISLAMHFWFENDFINPACLDRGGTSACPCGSPFFWNKNWFANVVLVPALVGQACLLLGGSLSAEELAGCTHITGRTYATLQTGISGVGPITGSNLLDISSIGVDQGLLASNASMIVDAYSRVHADVIIQNAVKADGIRVDGSFGQHGGLLYNGNYGKDYVNDVLNLEIEAGGTQYQASEASINAFSTLIDGDQWMIIRNTFTDVLHWDMSVLGRFISFAVADGMATASININLTKISQLGKEWNSDDLTQVFNSLTLNTSDANSGALIGNRIFFTNDYMVQRGEGYVTTLKMYSNRTQNSECVNTQNPFGFHLADGVVYHYINGDEYEDIAAAWDWNLIPGITVDYGVTPLDCQDVAHTGTQAFVGGVSDGQAGVAAMHYINPTSRSLHWKKTWFFLDDDVQFVMIAHIHSMTTAPVFSVLDQRRHAGDVFVNGTTSGSGNYTAVSSLWHGGVGYIFNDSNTAVSLNLQVGAQTGSWSSLGTSEQPPTTVDLFAAWLNHDDITIPVAYAVYPGTSFSSFGQKSQTSSLQNIRNDGSISALLDVGNQLAMIVFWETAGGQVNMTSITGSPIIVGSNGSAIIMLRMDSWTVTVADPTQSLDGITVNFTLATGTLPATWGTSRTKALNIVLPGGGEAGRSVTMPLVGLQPLAKASNGAGSSAAFRTFACMIDLKTLILLQGFLYFIIWT